MNFDKYSLLFDACKRMKYAAIQNPWNGRGQVPAACIHVMERYPASIIFTKETGYHTSGWWKNPEYERCWHLSISFKSGSEKKALAEILKSFFAPFENLIWVEPPYSDIGKQNNVWHYRLFCDINWHPIKPRGEVYNTHFTERGWKSFSELNKK